MRTLSWIDHPAKELLELRRKVYGRELGWIDSDGGWDEYDRHSLTLLVHEDAILAASARLSVEPDGPLEVSDLVDWRPLVPGGVAAEWSRVIIDERFRGRGLFRAMWQETLATARRREVTLLCGASTEEKMPLYQSLGFTYLERPFRSPFWLESPVYFPAWQRLT